MRLTWLNKVLIFAGIVFLLTVALFIWQVNGLFNSHSSIDAIRFSYFGSFVAGIADKQHVIMRSAVRGQVVIFAPK